MNDTQPIEIEVTKLIDIKEAADSLGVSPDHVRAFIADGDIEYVDVSRSGSLHREVRFTDSMIIEFIDRRSRRNAKTKYINQTKQVACSRVSATLSRSTDQGTAARVRALIEGNM